MWKDGISYIHCNLVVRKKSAHFSRKDGVNVSERIVDHKAKDSHLSGASLVKFDRALLSLPVIALLIPSKVNKVVSEVTGKFAGSGFGVNIGSIAVKGFHDSPCKDSLDPYTKGHSGNGGESGRNVFGARESDTGISYEVSDNGKHGNTAVLELDVTETIKVGLVFIGADFEGIKEAKGGLSSDFTGEFASSKSRVGALLRSRGEGGSRCNKGGEDSSLHGGIK